MDIKDLTFPLGEIADVRVVDEEPPPSPAQSPLTDRETAGFYRAMQDERERRLALERQLADASGASELPAPTTRERDLGLTVYTNNLRVSRRFAEREYGRDVVSTVHDWAVARCDTDPAFNARMRASDDPYEAAKQSYEQEQALSSGHNARSASTPPRSLADAPGNGAVGKPHVPVGDGNAYESLFK